MEMMYYELTRSSYQDSLKVLEDDIQHANSLAAAIPRGKGGARLQMKLSFLDLFHIIIYKVYSDGRPKRATQWRKASIRDFYAVILPSLRRLQRDLEMEDFKNVTTKHLTIESGFSKKVGGDLRLVNIDLEREDECGICLEPCAKIVLPNCCHAMCINCYRNWNVKSESCPFCRGSLKRVKSEDLWVLTCQDDVVDNETVSKEDLLRFYLYVNSLPKDGPDALFLVYYEYLI